MYFTPAQIRTGRMGGDLGSEEDSSSSFFFSRLQNYRVDREVHTAFSEKEEHGQDGEPPHPARQNHHR